MVREKAVLNNGVSPHTPPPVTDWWNYSFKILHHSKLVNIRFIRSALYIAAYQGEIRLANTYISNVAIGDLPKGIMLFIKEDPYLFYRFISQDVADSIRRNMMNRGIADADGDEEERDIAWERRFRGIY